MHMLNWVERKVAYRVKRGYAPGDARGRRQCRAVPECSKGRGRNKAHALAEKALSRRASSTSWVQRPAAEVKQTEKTDFGGSERFHSKDRAEVGASGTLPDVAKNVRPNINCRFKKDKEEQACG